MAAYEDVVSCLSDPHSYPEGGPVERCETHISLVFLTAGFAYKLMKPVDFGFLDFSTRESRYFDCWSEVCLNRRLAPDVYLDVVPITERQGGLTLAGSGQPVDWVVKMRRLPESATLDAHVKAGTAEFPDIDKTLALLLPFLQGAATNKEISAQGRTAVLRTNVLENLDVLDDHTQAAAFAPWSLAKLRNAQLQMLALREKLFETRVDGRWIRDGHGDLRAEHVYLLDPVVIVDCIEFCNRFRFIDTLDDICFLASDLSRLGREDLAAYLVDQYRQQTNDPAGAELIAFYQSYRHAVRAKVACLRASSGDEEERVQGFAQARRHVASAWETIERHHRPLLLAFCGLSGSGKSTISRQLAEVLGAEQVRSDLVRKELHGLSPRDRSGAGELYSARVNEQTYAEMCEHAGELLAQGVSVVLDATFQRASDRLRVARISEESQIDYLFVECRCREEVLRRRIAARQQRDEDASDAGFAVLDRQLEAFEPLDELPGESLMSLDAESPPEELVGQIVSRLAVM